MPFIYLFELPASIEWKCHSGTVFLPLFSILWTNSWNEHSSCWMSWSRAWISKLPSPCQSSCINTCKYPDETVVTLHCQVICFLMKEPVNRLTPLRPTLHINSALFTAHLLDVPCQELKANPNRMSCEWCSLFLFSACHWGRSYISAEL